MAIYLALSAPIAIGKVQLLQRSASACEASIAQKPCGELALARDMSLAHRHAPFGLRQALLKRAAVRGRTTPRLAWQRDQGRRRND
jgi:hypothetical protein